MSTPADTAPAIAGEANKPDTPFKVDIGEIRLRDDDAEETKKKKKKSRRPKKKGTGFEEFYCDPPMTPAQYEEEHEVAYPPHRPFVDRIEECIQRFRALRRMDNLQENVFSAYLLLGGVDATQRQFTGTSKLKAADLEGYTKAEVRAITADDVIQRGGDGSNDIRFYNPSFPEHWDVDFTGVVSGFLSENLVWLCGLNSPDYHKGVGVILNFLKYVALHDVCPEYGDDLRRAQKLCVTALEEGKAIMKLGELLPGPLNTAARMLLLDDPEEPAAVSEEPATDSEWTTVSKKPFDMEAARTILLAHSSVLLDNAGSERLQKAINDRSGNTIIKGTGCFEITDISLPGQATITQLEIAAKCMNQHFKQDLTLEACGKFMVRPTYIRDGWEVADSSGAPRMTTLDGEDTTAAAPEFFFAEMEALKTLKVGMTVRVSFFTLDNGSFSFISEVERIHQTFYSFLPQELMVKYKAPKLSERLAPSVYNPEEQGDVLDDLGLDD